MKIRGWPRTLKREPQTGRRKKNRILLAAQINQDEARLRQKKLLLFWPYRGKTNTSRESCSINAPVSKSSKDAEPTTHSSRKRKADPVPSDDVLLINAAGHDYFDDQQPTASTSRRLLFGPATPPPTTQKPDLSTEWQKETVKAQLRLSKSKWDLHSSPKKSRSSSRRSEGSSERKQRPEPYVKLKRQDDKLLRAIPKPRNTIEKSVEGDTAQSRETERQEPAALASPRLSSVRLISPSRTSEPAKTTVKSTKSRLAAGSTHPERSLYILKTAVLALSCVHK